MSRTGVGISISRSWLTSCRMRLMGKMGDRSSGPMGWSVPGCSGGAGGLGRSETRLYDRLLVVHHVFRPDDSYQVLQVGSLLPLHATGMGKALLAANPYVLAELDGEELTRFTPSTISDVKQLSAALKEVKKRGWAADIGELVDGEGSVAAPITDRSERTVGAIAISGPVERLCDAELPRSDLVAYVRESARAISRDLGAIPW